MTNRAISCPKCNGRNLIKRGFRKTQNRGLIQRHTCKNCGFRFVQNDGFFRMRNTPQKITLCLDLFYRGVSTRKVQEHLQAFYPHNSSWVSVYNWIIKYSKKISQFTNKLKLNLGFEVQIDEVEMHRRKSHKAKRGIDKNWFIDSICPKTRFLVASDYCKARGNKQINGIIETIKDKVKSPIQQITTDGWKVYENLIRKSFGYNFKENKPKVFHKKSIVDKNGFNYPIERLHNNIRARTKIFRGFHGSIESANAIMKGFEVFYNFINKHQGIDCCPYELATNLKLKSENKWLELINKAQNLSLTI